MGITITYICPKCGNTIEISEGIGMMWQSFDKSMFYPPEKGNCEFNIYDEIVKNNLADEVQKFIESSDKICISNVYYQPYICKKCGKVESEIYFRIDDLKSGKFYTPKFRCECGHRLKNSP